jgi:murein DD-endopeptidase MepM/ murein hydrolase activator NlpD
MGYTARLLIFVAAFWLILEVLRPVWLPQRTSAALAGAFGAVAPTARPVSAPPVVQAPSGGRGELWPGATTCAGWHAGATDWCGAEGQPVHAPASGTLRDVGAYTDAMRYGAYVVIETPGGLEVYIGHLNHEDVNPAGWPIGAHVAAGEVVGYLSEFAYSTPHTHIQLRRGGALVAPDAWWHEWEGR